MSYEKNTWSNGDVITAEKLNHIENGIENESMLVVNITGTITNQGNYGHSIYSNLVADKSFADVMEALLNNKNLIINFFGSRENVPLKFITSFLMADVQAVPPNEGVITAYSTYTSNIDVVSSQPTARIKQMKFEWNKNQMQLSEITYAVKIQDVQI